LNREEKAAHVDAEGLAEIVFRRGNERLRIDEAQFATKMSILPFSSRILA
jgi:hypothetical protein